LMMLRFTRFLWESNDDHHKIVYRNMLQLVLSAPSPPSLPPSPQTLLLTLPPWV
jgi:hypothetical protein